MLYYIQNKGRKTLQTRKEPKMNKMTVKELMELLSKYNEDAVVEIAGGEDGYGEWSQLTVDDDVILEY